MSKNRQRGLIVDLFAGGGGASTGIAHALGRDPDIAVNHSAAAIAMHEANHPTTKHLCASVWDVVPREVCGRREVELLWASPDCRHFSRAKGSAPVSKGVRSLAHVVIEWARAVRPRLICLENVEEFAGWGPVLDDGRPCPRRKGESFRAWLAQLDWLGYRVEYRSLVAADYGAPTTRRRLFLVARRDGDSIAWPTPTHGPGLDRPWRTAAEIIDWSVPCPSIFERRRPLAEATQRRIARGLQRFVLETAEPFIVKMRGTSAAHIAASARSIHAPIGTISAGGIHHALVAAWITKHYGGVTGHGLDRPIGTITSQDHHSLTTATLHPGQADHRAEVRAFLVKYYGSSTAAGVRDPLDTVTTRDRFGLVTVAGRDYEIADIGMRMLTPRELFAAQGFPPDYDLLEGRITKTQQIALAGNSVCPPVAEALIRAQFGRTETRSSHTMEACA